MKETTIICVGCPMGCRALVRVDQKGEVIEVEGCRCKEGRNYVIEEFRNPVRVLTATVLTEGSRTALLPVRTDRPIPKDKMLEGMKVLARTRARPPLKAGAVLIEDLLGTGASVIATRDLDN